MSLLIFKTIFAVSIFLLTWFVGTIPLKIASRNIKSFGWCNTFASGVFLGIALLHLLPEATSQFQTLHSNCNYPLIYLICIATYVSFVVVERLIIVRMAPFFLVLSLGVHSLLEGAAIGANSGLFEAIMLFFAVFMHKGSESFSLIVNLHRFKLSIKSCRQILAVFSLITPLGIFLASTIMHVTSNSSVETIMVYFNAVAAGMFLHLGTNHLIECIHTNPEDPDIHCHTTGEKLKEMLALILGVVLMAIAAWV